MLLLAYTLNADSYAENILFYLKQNKITKSEENISS